MMMNLKKKAGMVSAPQHIVRGNSYFLGVFLTFTNSSEYGDELTNWNAEKTEPPAPALQNLHSLDSTAQ